MDWMDVMDQELWAGPDEADCDQGMCAGCPDYVGCDYRIEHWGEDDGQDNS